MRKFYSFPDIQQFRNVITNVNYRVRHIGDGVLDDTIALPVLKYTGTVKLHGTNAGVIFTYNEVTEKYEYHVQSRGNIITINDDNAGFAKFIDSININNLLKIDASTILDQNYPVIRVYGEFCGQGIQKGVAISKLEKMFVVFAVKVGDVWLNDTALQSVKDIEHKIYNILDYTTYEIYIDFNDVKTAAEKMGKLVESIEKQCPVGMAFGQQGIGEGLVWCCKTPGFESSKFWFKTKGDEHKTARTREKVAVDVERVNNIKELVDTVLTEARLLQGIDQMNQNYLDIDRKNLGFYLAWINRDVIKEESDTIEKNGFTFKDINAALSKKARDWFFIYEDNNLGL